MAKRLCRNRADTWEVLSTPGQHTLPSYAIVSMASGSQLDATLPETPPERLSNTARLVALHKRMKDELDQIVGDEVTTQRMLRELQADLSLSKRAYTSLDSELSALRERSRNMEMERDDLLNKLKGQEGGHKAASMLAEGIMRHLPNRNSHQLWVYGFLNKRGLSDTFSRFSEQQARLKLDDFMIGFNQSTERFIMVDVGGAKEAADAKIKALFEAEIRLPQTECIIFAGCHDNGYVTTLRSHITSGSRDKLILLQSYDEVASGIGALNLPIISIPYLFINQKLAPTATPQSAATTSSRHSQDEIEQIINSEVKSQELLKEIKNDLSVSKRAYSSLEHEFLSLRELKEELERQRDELLSQVKVRQPGRSTFQANVLLTVSSQSPQPNRLVVLIDGDGAIFDLDLIAEGQIGGHKAASKLSDGVMQNLPARNNLQLWVYVFLNRRGLSDTFVRVSRLSAKISRQKLDDFIVGFNQAAERFIMVDVGNAKEAADAKIKAVLEVELRSPQTDSIIFGASEMDDLRLSAKKVPCTLLLKGETCTWSDSCIWGHKCPFLGRCYFVKTGKCKFSAESMHTLG
ncbi:hypothetical protein H1R20_g10300, partial [Candolleomyces eurysporus]